MALWDWNGTGRQSLTFQRKISTTSDSFMVAAERSDERQSRIGLIAFTVADNAGEGVGYRLLCGQPC